MARDRAVMLSIYTRRKDFPTSFDGGAKRTLVPFRDGWRRREAQDRSTVSTPSPITRCLSPCLPLSQFHGTLLLSRHAGWFPTLWASSPSAFGRCGTVSAPHRQSEHGDQPMREAGRGRAEQVGKAGGACGVTRYRSRRACQHRLVTRIQTRDALCPREEASKRPGLTNVPLCQRPYVSLIRPACQSPAQSRLSSEEFTSIQRGLNAAGPWGSPPPSLLPPSSSVCFWAQHPR